MMTYESMASSNKARVAKFLFTFPKLRGFLHMKRRERENVSLGPSARKGIAALVLLFATSAHADPLAYSTSGGDNTIRVIDTATNSVVDSMSSGGVEPRAIAISPDGATVYVANHTSNNLSFINVATHAISAVVGVGSSPIGVTLTADGRYAYVMNNTSSNITVVDTTSAVAIATIPVDIAPAGGPTFLTINPRSQLAYLGSNLVSNVQVIDTGTNALVGHIAGGFEPAGSVFTHDGKFAYVANYRSNNVSVVDTATQSLVSSIPVAAGPVRVAISPDDKFVYVCHFDAQQISVIQAATNTVVRTINTGASAIAFALSADGSTAHAIDTFSGLDSIVNVSTGSVVATVNAGVGIVTDIAIAPSVRTNARPVADAGPDQSIRAGATVTLNGAASFDDNTTSSALVYGWTLLSRPGNSAAMLTGSHTATPSFFADVAGNYAVELVVTDEGGLTSAPDEVNISSANLAPAAHAGDDQLVIVGRLVSLDGSASSDPEHDHLSFAWALTGRPAGSVAPLGGVDTPTPYFIPDQQGMYQASLRVSDAIGPSQPDSVTVTATTAQGFAEAQLVNACDTVMALPLSSITTAGNRNAFCNFLSQAVTDTQSARTASAISKIGDAMARTDGCAQRGTADGNGPGRDWITECDAQIEIYGLLNAAIDALR
jgi:YVTN family beta-propeller protein